MRCQRCGGAWMMRAVRPACRERTLCPSLPFGGQSYPQSALSYAIAGCQAKFGDTYNVTTHHWGACCVLPTMCNEWVACPIPATHVFAGGLPYMAYTLCVWHTHMACAYGGDATTPSRGICATALPVDNAM